MITWAICWTIVTGMLDSGVHLLIAMVIDMTIILGSVAMITDAIKTSSATRASTSAQAHPKKD